MKLPALPILYPPHWPEPSRRPLNEEDEGRAATRRPRTLRSPTD